MEMRTPAIRPMRAFEPALLLLLLSLVPCAAQSARNLVENGSFEESELGQVSMWTMDAQVNTPAAVRFFTTDVEKVSGRRSLAIANQEANDARAVQWIRTRPDTWYRISCWVQTRNISGEASGANISVLGSTRLAGNLQGTVGRWKYVELLGKTGPRQHAMAVLCRVGFYRNPAKGLALFDDFSVEELPGPPAKGHDTVDFGENTPGVKAVVGAAPFVVQAPPGFVPSSLLYGAGVVLAAVAVAFAASLPLVAARARRSALSQAPKPPSKWKGPYKGIEHRLCPRSSVSAQVVARRRGRGRAAGRFVSLRCANVSDTGIFLRCPEPSALALGEAVFIEAAAASRVLRLGTATVVGVRGRWDERGEYLDGGFALQFKNTGPAAARVRRRFAANSGAQGASQREGRPGV